MLAPEGASEENWMSASEPLSQKLKSWCGIWKPWSIRLQQLLDTTREWHDLLVGWEDTHSRC